MRSGWLEVDQEPAGRVDVHGPAADHGVLRVGVEERHLRRHPAGQAAIPGVEPGDVVVVAGGRDVLEPGVEGADDAWLRQAQQRGLERQPLGQANGADCCRRRPPRRRTPHRRSTGPRASERGRPGRCTPGSARRAWDGAQDGSGSRLASHQGKGGDVTIGSAADPPSKDANLTSPRLRGKGDSSHWAGSPGEQSFRLWTVVQVRGVRARAPGDDLAPASKREGKAAATEGGAAV